MPNLEILYLSLFNAIGLATLVASHKCSTSIPQLKRATVLIWIRVQPVFPLPPGTQRLDMDSPTARKP